MTLRLLATPLAAATLFVSTLACSRREDPNPDPTPTAGYTRNTRNVTCNAVGVHTVVNNVDFLVVTLTTTPQPASGPEIVTIKFAKFPNEPIGNYQAMSSDLTTTTATGGLVTSYGTTAGSVRAGSASGKVSGGFATSLTTPPLTAMTGGYFSDVQY